MADREKKQRGGQHAKGRRPIRGRDFAGTEFAADEAEQTRTRRAESRTTDEEGETTTARHPETGTDPRPRR